MINRLFERNSLSTLMIAGVIVTTALMFTTKYYFLAFLPSFAVVGLLLLTRYPQWGIYFLIFMIPFGAFRKFDMAGININISWIIAAPLFGIVIMQHLISKKSFKTLMSPLWTWFGLFFLVEIISTWLSPYTASAIRETKLWLASFLYIALLLMLLSRHAFKQTLPSILITSVFLSGFLGNLGFFLGFNLFTRDRVGGEFARSLGGAIDANNMSLMAIACIPLIVHRFFYSKMKWAKLVYGFAFINTAFTVGTSYSRGGFMIFLLACVLMAIEYRQMFKVKFIGFILLGVSLGSTSFVLMMPDSYWDRQKSLSKFEDSSLNRRAAYISVAMDAFMKRPVFGTGPDSFYHIFALTPLARISKETGEPLGRYAHNTYLEILVGMGITGLVIFLLILGKALYSFTWVRRRYKSQGDEEQASYINACRLFLFLVLLYLVIFSETHHKFMLVGLVMSQLAVRSYNEEQQLKAQESSHG